MARYAVWSAARQWQHGAQKSLVSACGGLGLRPASSMRGLVGWQGVSVSVDSHEAPGLIFGALRLLTLIRCHDLAVASGEERASVTATERQQQLSARVGLEVRGAMMNAPQQKDIPSV